MEWIYPIQLDRYGLAREGESLEFLREETGLDIEDREQFDLAWSALRVALKEYSTGDWDHIVGNLDHETLLFFRELLCDHADDAVQVAGAHKYALIRSTAFIQHSAIRKHSGG